MLRKIIWSTVDEWRDAPCFVMVSPAVMNAFSDGNLLFVFPGIVLQAALGKAHSLTARHHSGVSTDFDIFDFKYSLNSSIVLAPSFPSVMSSPIKSAITFLDFLIGGYSGSLLNSHLALELALAAA